MRINTQKEKYKECKTPTFDFKITFSKYKTPVLPAEKIVALFNTRNKVFLEIGQECRMSKEAFTTCKRLTLESKRKLQHQED